MTLSLEVANGSGKKVNIISSMIEQKKMLGTAIDKIWCDRQRLMVSSHKN